MKRSLITDLPNISLLSEETIDSMRNIFKNLDKTGDLTINRKLFIANLRKDVKISRLLMNPAVYLPKCDKVLILERVLHQIEREEYFGEEINRKAKENITWQHFIAHFINYQRILYISRENFSKLKGKIDLRTIFDDQELIDLSSEQLLFLKEIFDSMEKTQENYVFMPDLLKKIRNSEKFEYFSNENARRPSLKFSLPNEKISEVLGRIQMESDDNLDWDEFLEFFTRRGRPKYFIIDKEERIIGYKAVLDRILPQKVHTKKFKTLKKKFFIEENVDISEENCEENCDENRGKSKEKENINIVGYDSDPEYGLKQEKILENQYKKAKKVGFFGAIFKENIDKENFHITIPKPFSFEERVVNKSLSQIKLEKSLINKDIEELNVMKIRFKAQKVPKNVKDLHLWEKISKKNENRRIDVKKHSKAMTKQNEKPFSFFFRDKMKKAKKTKEQREKYKFKANPAPWFASIKMMIDPETKDRERREKMVQNANISLSLSRLPPRMEQYEKEKVKIFFKMRFFGRKFEKAQKNCFFLKNRKLFKKLLNFDFFLKKREKQATGTLLVKSQYEFTFRPVVSGKIPDFSRLQRNFEEILEAKKQNFVPTVPTAPICFSQNTVKTQ